MARPVICLETGESFPTYNDAARAYGLSGTDIRKAVVHKSPIKGLNWRLAYEVDREQIRARQSKRPGGPRLMVECEDGTLYPSIVDAARSVGVNSQTLRRAMREFVPCGGKFWRWKEVG